ncbi:MAG: 23S rRNA (guanosine(2251)-2'-O)-methyltransferase RlmB [Flavisolibacter sp.]
MEALTRGQALDRIYISNGLYGKLIDDIAQVAKNQKVPIFKVPIEKINSFNVFDHGGFVATLSKVQYQDLQQVISFVVESGEVPLFIMLDGITDIRNIGGIARTSYCTGVHALIIPDKGVGALNEDAVLTSAGALEKIAVCRVNSLLETVEALHLNGIRVMASDMGAPKKVFEIKMVEPLCIILGSEEKGIHPSLKKLCDAVFTIPMAGNFESFNVSVAAGIILYEAMKQRMQ